MSVAIKSPSLYIQGFNELAKLGTHAKKLGNKFFILCTGNTRKRIEEAVSQSLKESEKDFSWCAFSGKCTKEEIARVMEECRASGADVVLGAGGGTAVDTAKAAADNLDLPLVIVPTIASNDAPCSAIAVIYNDQGVVVKAQMIKQNPNIVLVDTAVIAKAPARLFAAGIGDALATWFEARAVHASKARTMARAQCSNSALSMAKLCFDILMQDGVQAYNDVKQGNASPAVENVVEATIFLSGLGFESGGLAAAHAINDSLVYLPGSKEMYHGERVAFGTLVQLVLEKTPAAELEKVMQLMKEVNLPMSLAQLGASTPVDDATLTKVAEAACVPTQSTKNMPFPVSVEDVLKAIKETDRLGSSF